MPYLTASRLHMTVVLAMVTVFALDLLLPLGVASGVFYGLPILVGLALPGRRETLTIAAAAVLLVVLGGLLSPAWEESWSSALVDRALAVSVVSGATLVVLRYQRAVHALDEERLRARRYLDVAHVITVALDHEGTITLINRRGCELLGRRRSEIVGLNWFDSFVPERLREEIRDVHIRHFHGETPPRSTRHENEVLLSDGTERLIAWDNESLRDPRGQVVEVLASGRDITELHHAEQALQRTVKELSDFQYALDASSILAITDARGLITYANDNFCRIAQYSRDELLGQDHRLVNSGHHPKAFMTELWETISSGQVWKGEIRNRAKDGSHYWVDTTIVPFLDVEGRPYQYLAIRSDITERKRAEQELSDQRALVRLGEMTAVVAHEVKNPLAGIAGAIQVLRERLPKDSPDRDVIRMILERIDALNATVQDLLVFARPLPPRPSAVPLRALLAETVTLMQQDPQWGRIEVELPHTEISLKVDRDQMRDVFQNLLINAAQAMDGEGRLTVSVERDETQVTVRVADNGPGVPAAIRERVFEPFVTTRHRGTGLGLAVVRRVVQAHGGEVDLTCPAGGGTVVSLSLPATSVQRAE
ncbi:MAG: PAS domain-containing sensor histidine kinase [Planctomycetota bacterium]|jgi:PAS domain S-box-containing protein